MNVFDVPSTIASKTDLRLDDYSYAYVGIGTDEEIRVQVTSTLKELEIKGKNYFFNKEDTVQIKSFGIEDESTLASRWLVNAKSNYEVFDVSVIDLLANKYTITTYDEHDLEQGYLVEMTDNAGNVVRADVTDVTGKTTLNIKSSAPLNLNSTYILENQLLRPNSTTYGYLNSSTANVQNTYSKFDGDVIVASNSLPNYVNEPINPYNKSLKFTGAFT